MKWIALVAAVVLPSAGASAAQGSASGPRISGVLPRESLLVAGNRDTMLVGLDGRVHGRIAGVQPPWSAGGARNEPFLQLVEVLPDRDFVVDRAGRWFVLERSGLLRSLPKPKLRLPDGAVVTAYSSRVDVRLGGRIVRGVQRISGSLVVAPSSAVDLDTGARWGLASDCEAVGVVGARLLELCGPSGDAGTVVLQSVSSDGKRRTLSALPDGLYAGSASISPNGKWIAATFTPGCGTGFGFVIPTSGGPARALTGEANWTVDGPSSSTLGWTADDRLVARIEPSRQIDVDPRPGIYVIDPLTLNRTLVYRGVRAWAFWTAVDR